MPDIACKYLGGAGGAFRRRRRNLPSFGIKSPWFLMILKRELSNLRTDRRRKRLNSCWPLLVKKRVGVNVDSNRRLARSGLACPVYTLEMGGPPSDSTLRYGESSVRWCDSECIKYRLLCGSWRDSKYSLLTSNAEPPHFPHLCKLMPDAVILFIFYIKQSVDVVQHGFLWS